MTIWAYAALAFALGFAVGVAFNEMEHARARPVIDHEQAFAYFDPKLGQWATAPACDI